MLFSASQDWRMKETGLTSTLLLLLLLINESYYLTVLIQMGRFYILELVGKLIRNGASERLARKAVRMVNWKSSSNMEASILTRP
jgi:hypothetical protein